MATSPLAVALARVLSMRSPGASSTPCTRGECGFFRSWVCDPTRPDSDVDLIIEWDTDAPPVASAGHL